MKRLLFSLSLLTSLYAQHYSITKGWQLLGAFADMDTKIFDPACVEAVWKYNNQTTWQLYIADTTKHPSLSYPQTFTHIKKGEGFWVLGKETCTLSLPLFTYKTIGSIRLSSAEGLLLYDDTTLFVCDKDLVRILDMSDPSNIRQSAAIISYDAHNLALSKDKNTLFIADDDGGVRIIDITDILNPQYITSFYLKNGGYDYQAYSLQLVQDGKKLFVGTKYRLKTFVLDISTPGNPELIEVLDTDTVSRSIAIDDSLLYKADYIDGLYIVDTKNDTIKKRTNIRSWSFTRYNDRYLFAASGDIGVQILDIQDPLDPKVVQTITTDGFARYLTFSRDTKRFFVTTDKGVFIYTLSPLF